jgi:hypothetical protein
MENLIKQRRVSYVYFEYTPFQRYTFELDMLDAAGYMCFDHAAQFKHNRVPFRLSGLDQDATPGDEMILSTGAKWREYYAKTRPSARSDYMRLMARGGMQQTDLLCILGSEMLGQ